MSQSSCKGVEFCVTNIHSHMCFSIVGNLKALDNEKLVTVSTGNITIFNTATD